MLELKNISYKKDNKIILNNINLNIKNNSLIVITGPNGSGKSSLAKIIMGINFKINFLIKFISEVIIKRAYGINFIILWNIFQQGISVRLFLQKILR